MRLFVALQLSDEAVRHLQDVQDALREPLGQQISWTSAQNLHLTLKFLGEVPDGQVEEIARSLASISGRDPFALAATGLWWAPPRGPTRVIGATLGGDELDSLLWLHERIEDKSARLGFDRKPRIYSPHVTLARPRGSHPLGAILQSACADQFPGPSFHIDRFHLVQSRLHPAGSQYTTIASFAMHV